MISFTPAIVASFAFAVFAEAISETFNLIAINAESNQQYPVLFVNNSSFYFGNVGNSSLSGIINDCGQLKLSNDHFVTIGYDGLLQETDDRAKASSGFSIHDGQLSHKGAENGFFGSLQIHQPPTYLWSTSILGNESISVLIGVEGKKGQLASDFAPAGNCTVNNRTSETTTSSYTTVSESTHSWTYLVNGAGMRNALETFNYGFGTFGIVAALLS